MLNVNDNMTWLQASMSNNTLDNNTLLLFLLSINYKHRTCCLD